MSRKKKELPIRPLVAKQLRIGSGKKGAFQTYRWTAISSSSELTRSEAFWHVRSSVGKHGMLKYLRLQFYWNNLTKEETEFAFGHPEFLKDVEFNVLLALLTSTELTRSEIARRSEKAHRLLQKKSNFRKELVPQWDNNIRIVADLEHRSIRPHKAYSGWVRNASSVGSKRRKPSIPDPISEEWTEEKFDEYNFFYELISVGSIETSNGLIRLP